ncbi:MAG: putative pyridoxine/pyridoxamine 5-phosphate oxidase [Actinomycetia bacterium]|nr:putative pyridoxine/pyridoxamine 5-phosphate oxidase [Actinomycetes bacterium]
MRESRLVRSIRVRTLHRMSDLDDFARTGGADQGLCVVTTVRGDGSVQASVVNAGVLDHPVSGARVVGLVAAGGSRKLTNLRLRPRSTLVAKSGWQWVAVEGSTELIGPDDTAPGIDADRLRLLLREIFTAAGGTHDNWAEYDRVMASEGRTAVLVTPARVYSNS